MKIEESEFDKIKTILRSKAIKYLDVPNINSVGIGRKNYFEENPTDELSIQFTVDRKIELEGLESVNTVEIPKEFELGKYKIPSDVIQRKFQPTYIILEDYGKNNRKKRQASISPGISISHINGTAGTVGCIVYDNSNNSPYVLSNWHVLQGDGNDLGDPIVQPGPFDDNENVQENIMGHLVRSHLGVAGDCAICTIENREIKQEILDLGIIPNRICKVELDDRVVKSGRTTGVTYGIVTRIEVTSKLYYGDLTGSKKIGGFEIGPDPDHPAKNNEISMGGDSGCSWMIRDKDDKITDIIAGLHFAGESTLNPEEFALACNIYSVFKKLDIGLAAEPVGLDHYRKGYIPDFLGNNIYVPLPDFNNDLQNFVLYVNDDPLLHYIHFSLVMHNERCLAIYTAHNIDGKNMKKVKRDKDNWKFDQRIDRDFQIGNEGYVYNPWDRGHLVRRAAVLWGSLHEAKLANDDTFHYTNAAPQHENFNRDEWVYLEDWVLDRANVDYYKLCVFTGPVFTEQDEHTGIVSIPRAFWKIIAMRTGDDAHLSVTAFLMNQYDMLHDRTGRRYLELKLYQVDLSTIEEFTGLIFSDELKAATPKEIIEAAAVIEGIPPRPFSIVTGPEDLII
jgi:endonuclease G